MVFRRLYREQCLRALLSVINSQKFAEDLCICIEDDLGLLFQAFDLDFETAAQVHANNIKRQALQWGQLKSHQTCLFCIRRKPEHVLTCEHALCDACLVIFGSPVPGKEHYFGIDSCLFCLTKGQLVARLKPSTAGVRLLSVDGGGVRGVVPLEFLGLLQGLLESDLFLQDLFEQAFGTSSGKCIHPYIPSQKLIIQAVSLPSDYFSSIGTLLGARAFLTSWSGISSASISQRVAAY